MVLLISIQKSLNKNKKKNIQVRENSQASKIKKVYFIE
jgi:hypothetical protein